MSQTDDTIDAALSNLNDIKRGNDPRTSNDGGNEMPEPAGPLSAARQEVDRLYREHDLQEILPRACLHVAIARWEGRNGNCKYNTKLDESRFGKRVTDATNARGSHSIITNARMWDQSNTEGFYDTVRHELAHAIAYADYGESQKHNSNWKEWARRLGADPASCHNKHETKGDYMYGCPNGCWTSDKKRRSKKIKKPWQGPKRHSTRFCKQCDATPVSWDRGKERPEEPGTVDIDGIPWSNKEEWRRQR
jgi:predicted SprT family Zn-dependent metalloprotease